MAKGRRKTQVEEEVSAPRLSEAQLSKMDLYEARLQMQYVVLDNLSLKANALSTEYRNQMAAFKAQTKNTNDSLQKIKQEHNKFVAEVEAEWGISLKDYSIEPDGYLQYNPLPDGPNTESSE